MLYKLQFEKILFLDIETVPAFEKYEQLPERFRKLWDRKCEYLRKEEGDTPDVLFKRAGIYAEFGKIICISTGFFSGDEFRIKSFYGDDEATLLNDFAELLNNYFNKPEHLLCAHNGKEFDFPYIARRMLINGIMLPPILNMAGKKPWEVAHLDTLELWKFGDFKSYTSLDLLTAVFGIPTPKEDIDGSMVGDVYYLDKDLPRIVEYCQRDTLAVAQLLRCYAGKSMVAEDKVIVV